ncbi:unnamed protein product [Nippostrongylus brasiliensis]|uniref:DDB1- and CUL4-associated factor 15 WD40 repeat-containing domain-containing protein n=1 Tax=Nippostrongylus brasiliensis TaxID=27835 RepID=A0A0N4XCC5_NIPBR|nr:unnamed protein product [Nippostrongylus brasiliensis]
MRMMFQLVVLTRTDEAVVMDEWISIERLDSVNGEEIINNLYSWIYSPSGRFAVDFDYKEIMQNEDEPDTYFYFFRFFVLDIVEKTWCPYTVNTGPFKIFVLSTDYRNNEFVVEYMCYSRDFTAQKFTLPEGDFLVLSGYREGESGTLCRLVPYYPYENISAPIGEFFIDTRRIIRLLTGDATLYTGGHPFVCGATMFILLYSQDEFETLYYINYTLQIDLVKALNEKQSYIAESGAVLATMANAIGPGAHVSSRKRNKQIKHNADYDQIVEDDYDEDFIPAKRSRGPKPKPLQNINSYDSIQHEVTMQKQRNTPARKPKTSRSVKREEMDDVEDPEITMSTRMVDKIAALNDGRRTKVVMANCFEGRTALDCIDLCIQESENMQEDAVALAIATNVYSLRVDRTHNDAQETRYTFIRGKSDAEKVRLPRSRNLKGCPSSVRVAV